MDEKLKHLEFVQGVINRLSTNSFLLKGWSVLLVSTLISVGVKTNAVGLVVIAYLPASIFWGLDGFFLWQERMYRNLYNFVRSKDPSTVDFCMDTRKVSQDVDGWIKSTLSKTLLPFHGVLVVSIFIAILYA